MQIRNRLIAGETILVVLCASGFAWLFSYPSLLRPSAAGVVWDWPEVLQRNWVPYYTITHFHQFPFWNAWACGGMPLFAHPLSAVMTPLFALQLVFGSLPGLHFQIAAHLMIAWIGGYMLARRLNIGLLGRLMCASVFPGSSWFHLRVAVGHLCFLPEAYLPWVALLVWIASEQRRAAPLAAAGVLLAIMFGEGGIYPFTQALMFVGFMVVPLAFAEKRLWPLWCIVILTAFGVGFAAIKIAPTWFLIRAHPRDVVNLEYNPVVSLLKGLFAWDQYYDRSRVGEWGFWEAGAYIGMIVTALAVLGGLAAPSRTLPWLFTAILFFLLAIGGPHPWYPWALLHHLPIIASERVPNRSLMPFTLAIGVLAGFGTDFVALRARPFGAALAILLLIAAVHNFWLVATPDLNAPVAGELRPIVHSEQFHQEFLETWSMAEISMSNIGALHCNEELDFHDVGRMKVKGSNQPGYRGEQYLLAPGTVALSRWTPNVLSYDVNTQSGNTMVVNQNYDPNWRVVEGNGEVFPADGLIGINLPGGPEHLVLAYRDFPFMAGAALTLLTGFVAMVVWRRERRLAARLQHRLTV